MFKEMARQNIMIETIKDKLRDRNLDVSPSFSDGGSFAKRLINGSSSDRGSAASSRVLFDKAKEQTKREQNELSNGSKGTPASCNEAVNLSQVSNDGLASQLHTVYKCKNVGERQGNSLKAMRPERQQLKTPEKRGRNTNPVKNQHADRESPSASSKKSLAYRLKDYLTGKKQSDTPAAHSKAKLNTTKSQDLLGTQQQHSLKLQKIKVNQQVHASDAKLTSS